jgi:hypothetical protein
MLSKPNFFLDTSVCIDVAREKTISANDWARTWGICKTKFHYCISPVTQFDRHLWQFIRNPDYNFSKHRGEIVDAQQLYYLCQPNIYFVTNDTRLKEAVSDSPQGRRVMTYQELTEWLRPKPVPLPAFDLSRTRQGT